jgi:hypothetical protein
VIGCGRGRVEREHPLEMQLVRTGLTVGDVRHEAAMLVVVELASSRAFEEFFWVDINLIHD